MLVQAEPHMATTVTNTDQVMARQHSQDSTFSHLSPTRNQTIHVQAHATFPPRIDGKDVRLQRLEMLQESLKSKATSSNDPRSWAYATLHERAMNPELRYHNFLEIPATRQGLVGGRGESSSYEINQKREEIAVSRQRIDNLEEELGRVQSSLANADEADKGQIFFSIVDLNSRLAMEQSNLHRLQGELSDLQRNT